ncbi:ImmA/IrrE family metallo-endopeptidase [Clostridium sp. YIM B02555]|uniref:ImmA/IrrE family metallo-endopeptidase n=1 Tax=Clostridium sp. YIM B02555 TaxID=2911968 RepID=UPI001EEE00E3|nr:ImmA/IrrE family metallo-endopeptidase [Clostridium sp. YIM B02555]
MKKLKKMFEIINSENIVIEEPSIIYKNLAGLYLNLPNCLPVIFIKKSLLNDARKYKSILAEELGHHFTTTGDLTIKSKNYRENLYKNKKEEIAKKWAANFLISDEEFVQALCNCISTPYDICNYFNITNEMLQYKIYSIVLDDNRYSKIKDILIQKEVPYESCAI